MHDRSVENGCSSLQLGTWFIIIADYTAKVLIYVFTVNYYGGNNLRSGVMFSHVQWEKTKEMSGLKTCGRYFRNFWVGMCLWDSGTLCLYQR